MKLYKSVIIIVLISIIILFNTCSMNPSINLTIYNNTNITDGELHLIYGDYQGYADDEQYLYNVTFPYKTTITNCSPCINYIIIATLKSSDGASWGDVICDTNMSESIDATIDMMLYIVRGPDNYEPDNSFEEAHTIQAGEYQARSLTDENDIDYIIFYAASGRNYIIETDIPASASEPDTVLSIYEPGKSQIAYDDNSGAGMGSKISWIADYTGVCYIKVDKSRPYNYGSYGLSLYWTYSKDAGQSGLLKLREWSKRNN